MRLRLLPLFVFAVLAAPAGGFPPVPKGKDKKPAPKDIAKALEGTWEVTKMERGGGVAKVSYTMTMKIEGKKFTQVIQLNGRELKSPDSTFTLDTSKTPATFEVKTAAMGGRPEYVRMKGVLKVESDVLTMVYATLKADPPKKVDGELAERHMRMTLKRVKK